MALDTSQIPEKVHPWKWTWNPKMKVWKTFALFNHMIFRFRVKFSRGQTREIDMRLTSLPEFLWNDVRVRNSHTLWPSDHRYYSTSNKCPIFFPKVDLVSAWTKKSKVTQTKLKTGFILSISTASTLYMLISVASSFLFRGVLPAVIQCNTAISGVKTPICSKYCSQKSTTAYPILSRFKNIESC